MTNVVNLRARRPPINPRHPSLYDHERERPALPMIDVTTIPLSLNGVEWSVLVGELRNSQTFAVKSLGDEIARQIRCVLEDK